MYRIQRRRNVPVIRAVLRVYLQVALVSMSSWMKKEPMISGGCRVFLAAFWVSLVGIACGAPQAAPAPIDLEYELDVLYGCALSTLEESGYVMDWREDAARMAATEWRELREGERHRASVAVALHPTYGPGATARLHVEGRAAVVSGGALLQGDAAVQNEAASGVWTRVERARGHADWESGYLQEVQACWRERR